jgi:hypothetical protein
MTDPESAERIRTFDEEIAIPAGSFGQSRSRSASRRMWT